MWLNNESTEKALPSIRWRYLLLASLVASLLVAGAILASWYAHTVSDQNTSALKFRDTVSASIADIRNSIRAADIALNTMLITPRHEYEQTIRDNLTKSQRRLQQLSENRGIESAGLLQPVRRLQSKLDSLRSKVEYLLQHRNDPNWVYPLLPYINKKLLEPNIEFETAVEQALWEIAEEDGRAYASPLYGKFDAVRDLWRSMILNFRAVMIRFAGLNDIEVTPQEKNIEDLHSLILQRLATLQKLKQQGELGLESENAVEHMQAAASGWMENWYRVRKLRASSVWRNDIDYMGKAVQPALQGIFNALTEIDEGISAWSVKNVSKVQQAANTISYELWALAGLALAFVVLVYYMIELSVLRPIERIAGILSRQEPGSDYQLEGRDSREIDQLVTAFNVMRRQIHQRQVALEHQALHDSLTGLPNRVLLQDRLAQSIHLAKRHATSVALLLLDLDRFKEVNDTLGHQVGDQLLQKVGQRLEGILRETDTVARLGGDEFAIVAPDIDAGQAVRFAEKIVNAIREVFQLEKQNLYVGASIGVALVPQHGEDVETLIRHADIAMYVAKQKNLGFSLYDPRFDTHSIDQLALVSDLHDELKQASNLQLYYQPQIDLFGRDVVAVESLLRWAHPQLGFIAPEKIIKLAEHTDLIGELTQWVIETALRESRRFQADGRGIKVAINLSAWNLQDPDLPGLIARALHSNRVAAGEVIFEITESAMMNDPVRAREVLTMLSEMGVGLAIDDYGTGFSSLGYLKMLPVKELKIDKSFVIEMLDDENDAIIVHSTIELAHNLGFRVIAEGVENHETLLRLRQLKCDVAQGYYLSRPVPVEDFITWLENYNPRIAQ